MNKPTLTVPKPRVESQGYAEVRPRRVQEWLEQLPRGSHAEAARQIRQALYALNRVELEPDNRLEILELYRPPAAEVVDGLLRGVDAIGLPLPERAGERADAARAIDTELATGFKLVVHDATAAAGRSLRSESLALAAARAMEYLGRELLDAYDVYRPVAARTWRDLHALFQIAESLKLLNVPLDTRSDRPTTAARTYQRILLLGACNPYGMLHGDIRRVDEFLRARGARAQISADTTVRDPAGHFLINLSMDSAPVPFPRTRQIAPQPQLRVLNVIELVRDVHGLLKSLEAGEPPATSGLTPVHAEGSDIDLLRRLGRFWGLSIRRQSNRTQRSDTVSMCVGLGAVHFFLSGGHVGDDGSLDAGTGRGGRYVDMDRLPDDADAGGEGSGAPPAPAGTVVRPDVWERREEYVVYQWQSRDESAGGIALEREGEFETQVRVGELVALDEPAEDTWRIGVIRWSRSEGARQVEIGVQLLGPDAYAVTLVESAAGRRSRPVNALLFAASERLQRPETLVVPRGTFHTGMQLEMRDCAGGSAQVRPVQVVERTGTFEQFVFVRSVGA